MDALTRLKKANAEVRGHDKELDEELVMAPAAEGHPAPETPLGEFQVETIVRRTGRPVLAIKSDEAQLTFDDPESTVWQGRLTQARGLLMGAARAVGRIEVVGHDLDWVGTGWLIAPEMIVTNRHVAAEFGRYDGTSFVFRRGLDGTPMTASIDLLEEIDRTDSFAFELTDILHIEDPVGPDIAFLRVAQISGESPPTPISLALGSEPDELVAVIGYPARDSRIPDIDLMDTIFGNVYNKKRLAPGQLLEPQGSTIRHDCSTLGGNSGSVVLSLTTGEALGLHFAGRFLQANFAVSSTVVAQRLDDLRRGRPIERAPSSPIEGGAQQAAGSTVAAPRPSVTLTYLVPLSITVEVGEPQQGTGGTMGQASAPADRASTDGEPFVESVAADYADRLGYDETFIGTNLVPLPVVTVDPDDVLSFEFNGRQEQVLKYEHYSVVMSRSRKLCRFSAVNIDGTAEVEHLDRVGWRTDPRIPSDAQIRDACYGNSPKFSRGHMTRREDPNWGTEVEAHRGNADSMHVTNVVPQMQPFNAGIWLDLEEYALQNAWDDDMKICVFTGPFLEADDPTMYDVQIPVEFWKVIAFVHDETRQLCATGYTMSQRDFLKEEEFVFAQHETTQCSISSIEQRTGLSFGPLTALDPFVEPEGRTPRLRRRSQIQFVRRG